MKRPFLIWVGAAILLLGGGVILATILAGTPAETIQQPIAFNHKRHLAEGMACADCHKQVEKGPYATFPPMKQCLLCHSDPQGKHPDEPKIREFAERGEEIPWIQVNRLPGHVYFSHTAHVRHGKIGCQECHGDMKERTQPVTVSQIQNLTMERCMECHTQSKVSTDCLRCHK